MALCATECAKLKIKISEYFETNVFRLFKYCFNKFVTWKKWIQMHMTFKKKIGSIFMFYYFFYLFLNLSNWHCHLFTFRYFKWQSFETGGSYNQTLPCKLCIIYDFKESCFFQIYVRKKMRILFIFKQLIRDHSYSNNYEVTICIAESGVYLLFTVSYSEGLLILKRNTSETLPRILRSKISESKDSFAVPIYSIFFICPN